MNKDSELHNITNCQSLHEVAQAWFLLIENGTPTVQDFDDFESWKNANPEHKKAFDEIKALWTGIDELRDVFDVDYINESNQVETTDNVIALKEPVPETEPFQKGSSKMELEAPKSTGTNVFWRFGLAAVVVIVAITLLPFINFHITADYVAGVGEQKRIEMEDGSVIWLNTDTALAVEYSTEYRTIDLLYGEAYFDVKPDRTRPFSVLANDGRATAIGTEYSVKSTRDQAEVTVFEGIVDVLSPIGISSSESFENRISTLTSAQTLSYRTGEGATGVSDINLLTANAWKEGFIAITNKSIDDVLNEIGRYRPGVILLLGDTSNIEPLTARIAITSIDEGIETVATSAGLSIVHMSKYLVVVQ